MRGDRGATFDVERPGEAEVKRLTQGMFSEKCPVPKASGLLNNQTST